MFNFSFSCKAKDMPVAMKMARALSLAWDLYTEDKAPFSAVLETEMVAMRLSVATGIRFNFPKGLIL